jgi:hypothetical protein
MANRKEANTSCLPTARSESLGLLLTAIDAFEAGEGQL